ncbi:mechanosensitive ion channel [Candidatus Woesearchaeota archaeon]|nr:mechanosensitive ion channel [Candidatus Woesearchaeota archaeon]
MAIEYMTIITNIIAGLLVVGFGIIIGNIFKVVIQKILHSFEVERLLSEIGIRFPLEEFMGSLVQYGLYIAGLVLGLTFLGLEKVVLIAILIGIFLLLALFILLALKNFIPNFFAGIMIAIKKRFKEGDIIEMDTIEGKILHIGLNEIQVKTKDGDLVIIPNVLISRNILVKKKKN